MKLINTYHNTMYHTRKSADEVDRIASTPPRHRTPAEKQFVRRVRRTLCGINNCQCGDDLGQRNNQGGDKMFMVQIQIYFI